MSQLWDHWYTKEDAKIIKSIAWSVVGHYGYQRDDVEDVQQDLATHVWTRMHLYDPKRGPRARYVIKVAKNKLAHLIEKRTAKKRDRRRNVSTEGTGDGVLADRGSSPDRLDLQIDLRDAIDRMPKELRDVALLRCQQYNVLEIAALLGLTRAVARSRMKRVERILRDQGFVTNLDDEQPNGD